MRSAVAALPICLALTLYAQPAFAPPANACSDPEFRQLDFWLGEWNATWPAPAGLPAGSGTNHITKSYEGCVIEEHFDGRPGQHLMGHSVSVYHAPTKSWRQTWVDASNSRVDFVGGLVDGKMVLVGDWKGVNGPGKDAIIRMSYSKNPDGSVRQHGEQSTDFGVTWSNNFDFTYHPKSKPAG